MIEKIRIGHDGKGWACGWHLDKVEVRRLKDCGKVSVEICAKCIFISQLSAILIHPGFYSSWCLTSCITYIEFVSAKLNSVSLHI